jgi:hypothetical protein
MSTTSDRGGAQMEELRYLQVEDMIGKAQSSKLEAQNPKLKLIGCDSGERKPQRGRAALVKLVL